MIIYIKTSSLAFKTDEGLSIGAKVSDCLKYSKEGIRIEPGVCFYIPLYSGWNAEVGNINNNLNEIQDSGSGSYFFQINEKLSNNISYH